MSSQAGIHITDLQLSLERAEPADPASGGAGKVPFQSEVQSLRVSIADDVLRAMVEAALVIGRDRAPVDVELRSTRFIPEGAEVIVQVSKGRFFKTDVRALIAISAEDTDRVRVDIKEVKGLGKLPIDAFVEPVLDKLLDRASARPGIERAPEGRVLLIDPVPALARLGAPLRFGAGGTWRARSHDGSFETSFRSGA